MIVEAPLWLVASAAVVAWLTYAHVLMLEHRARRRARNTHRLDRMQ